MSYNRSPHICNHVRFGLRGCTRLRGHTTPHYNMWTGRDGATWNDEDGMFINSQEDWNKMVDALGDPSKPRFDRFK